MPSKKELKDRIAALQDDLNFWQEIAENRLTTIQEQSAAIRETREWLRLYLAPLELLKRNIEGDIEALG